MEKDFESWKTIRQKMKNCDIFYYDFPFEALSCEDLGENESAAGIDRMDIEYKTLKYLKEKGYRKVIKRIFQYENKMPEIADLEVESYSEKLKFFHKNHTDMFYEDGLIRTGMLLAESCKDYDFTKKKTAFYLYDNFVCSGFLKGLKKFNLEVPKDFGLILSWRESEPTCMTEVSAWQFPHAEMFRLLEKWLDKSDLTVRKKFDGIMFPGETLPFF